MHPGGNNPRPSTAPSGNSGAGGFRDGGRSSTNAPPCRQPPAQQQMTPEKKEVILMAAGRLAAEYLVSKGELPAHVLHDRLPAPLPFQERPPVPRPQQHQDQTFPRSFQQERPHFQSRPPAPCQFQQRPSFAPRPFQGQGRPIAKRPRQSFQWHRPAPHPAGRFQAGRPPFHSGARTPSPSVAGVAPAAAAAAGSVTEGVLNDAPEGDGNNSQHAHAVAQSGDADTAQSSQQMMDQPNQG